MKHGEIVQPAGIIAAALAGLLAGAFTGFGSFSSQLIEPFLMAMLFFVFLSVDGSGLRDSFRNWRFSLTALAVNFIWTPVFAMLLGYLFFSGNTDIRFGILLLLVTPCTDWFLVFTASAKGNTALSSAILPLNLLIQVIMLPVYAFLFFGAEIRFDPETIAGSILLVLAAPLLLAAAVRFVSRRSEKAEGCKEKVLGYNDEIQTVFLCLAVASMFASESQVLFDNPMLLVSMFVPMEIFFVFNYLLSSVLGKLQRWKFDDTTSLIFTSLARNSPLALAICAAAFPENAIALLILVIGPVIELPTLALAAAIRLRSRR